MIKLGLFSDIPEEAKKLTKHTKESGRFGPEKSMPVEQVIPSSTQP
jgi:hypothetical protein